MAKAKLLGHPIHPMLIAFPLGLFPVAVIFDITYLCSTSAHWAESSFWLIAAGVIGGLLAAVFGLVDWLGIQNGTRAKKIGLAHGLVNVVVVALFAASWLLRRKAPAAPEMPALMLEFIGLAVALVGAWLGAELVYRMGIAVDAGANPNSPSSLSGKPAAHDKRG